MASSGIDYEQIRTLAEKPFAFVERCGVRAVNIGKGHCRLLMPLEPNRNHIGTMYAGALFTLAELPGGVIYLSCFDTSRFYPIVKSLNLRFRRPASSDIEVEATLADDEVQRISEAAEASGKCDFQWTLELKDQHGEVVAIAESIYQLRKIGS